MKAPLEGCRVCKEQRRELAHLEEQPHPGRGLLEPSVQVRREVAKRPGERLAMPMKAFLPGVRTVKECQAWPS